MFFNIKYMIGVFVSVVRVVKVVIGVKVKCKRSAYLSEKIRVKSEKSKC